MFDVATYIVWLFLSHSDIFSWFMPCYTILAASHSSPFHSVRILLYIFGRNLQCNSTDKCELRVSETICVCKQSWLLADRRKTDIVKTVRTYYMAKKHNSDCLIYLCVCMCQIVCVSICISTFIFVCIWFFFFWIVLLFPFFVICLVTQ